MFELTGSERSPLEQLSQTRFGGRTFLQSAIDTISSGYVQILPNNPNRVFWMAVNYSAYDATLDIGNALGGGGGIPCASKGGIVSMSWEEDGEAVGYEVWGGQTGGTATLRVYEVIRE